MIPLAKSILATLAYFDVLDFPLTESELWRYLWRPPPAADEDFFRILSELSSGETPRLAENDGFWFLAGRAALVGRRLVAGAPSEQKLRRARFSARLLSSIPFLRAIFVSSSVAMGRATPESDIDFFIVAAPGRVWIVRFFSNLLLRLFRRRVYGAKKCDRVCLCFFIDQDHLDLAAVRFVPEDIHLLYWLHGMKPIYDGEDVWEKFKRANRWTSEYVPNLWSAAVEARSNDLPLVRPGRLGRGWKKMWETMWRGSYGNLVEREAKNFQLLKLRPALKAKAAAGGTDVIISAGLIKLHERDTRAAARERWQKKCEELEI